MKRKAVALILSALVVPGAGQIYLGRRVRGLIFIMLVNIFLLITLVLIMQAVVPTMRVMTETGNISRGALVQTIQESRGVLWSIIFFVCLWSAAIIDILLASSGERQGEQGDSHE